VRKDRKHVDVYVQIDPKTLDALNNVTEKLESIKQLLGQNRELLTEIVQSSLKII